MPYELALELKNAGFPQNTEKSYVFHESPVDGSPLSEPVLVPSHDKSEDWDTYVAAPTLEELIEEVGEKLARIQRHGNSWGAEPTMEWLEEHPMHVRYMDTPVEAVAVFWLALNKK